MNTLFDTPNSTLNGTKGITMIIYSGTGPNNGFQISDDTGRHEQPLFLNFYPNYQPPNNPFITSATKNPTNTNGNSLNYDYWSINSAETISFLNPDGSYLSGTAQFNSKYNTVTRTEGTASQYLTKQGGVQFPNGSSICLATLKDTDQNPSDNSYYLCYTSDSDPVNNPFYNGGICVDENYNNTMGRVTLWAV